MGKAIATVVIVVILALAGLGFYIYNDSPDTEEITLNTPQATSVISTSTPAVTTVTATNTGVGPSAVPGIPSTGDSYVAPKPAASKPKPASSQTASVYRAVPTNSYHNATFGLTVPGIYTVTSTRNQYAGVWNTASLNFYQSGVLAFTVNVWSKEQWNDIRIQETINADNGNQAGTYFGEGTYLGENFTWIFSVIPGSYGIPSGIRFY